MLSQAIIFGLILSGFIIWIANRHRIRYWAELLHERGWKSTIHYDRCLKLYNELYDNINAMTLSLKERKEKDIINDTTYTYGEVTFYSFVRILEMAKPQPNEVFYDLGSGGGKAVFIAGLVFDFSKAYGIEKLDTLYQLAVAILKKLETLPGRSTLLPNKSINIEFIQSDFLKYDFSDGDIIFVNATCFRGEIFNGLVSQLLKLKKGARVILGSARLDEIGGFELKYTNQHLMSWGLSTINIYERI